LLIGQTKKKERDGRGGDRNDRGGDRRDRDRGDRRDRDRGDRGDRDRGDRGDRDRGDRDRGDRGGRDRGGDGNKSTIFVGNLGFKTSENTIRSFFRDCGKVLDIRIAKTPDGKAKGFCHIDFESQESVDKALSKAGEELDGRQIKIDESKQASGGFRGGSRGGGGFRGGRGGRGGGGGYNKRRDDDDDY